MRPLQARISERYPQWFRGRRAAIARPLLRGIARAQVPMLYRQYVDLCEPGGARFLAFGVDPGFSDAIDGLVEVDLSKMRSKKRQRYLGEPLAEPAEAA